MAWIQGLGAAGVALYIVLYVLVTVLVLPASLLTVAAGFIYGPVAGFALVWPSAVIGACVAFGLGRTLLRSQVEARLADHPRFAAVDRAVSREGARLLLLMRLSPMFPFSPMNYAAGLTGIRPAGYTLATALGIAPGTLLYIYLGASLGTLSAALDAGFEGGVEGRPAQQILYWGGLLATVAVTVTITRLTRRALVEHLGEE